MSGPAAGARDGLGSILGPPAQIAYAVPDAEAAARRWATDLGAGPFLLRPHIELAEVVHRGRPAVFDHTSAYGQWGSIMVELVQDHGSGPSPIRDRFGPDETGLHHLAFLVDDLEAALEALAGVGHPELTRARTTGGTTFCFVDAVDRCGHLLELYETSSRLRAFYDAVARAAQGWDGSNPVRSHLG